MKDYALRGVAADGNVRFLAAATTELVEEARRRHQTSPTATAALGRMLTAACLLGMDLQDEETLTLRVIGDGPLGGIITTADSRGQIRGYAANPGAEMPSLPNHKLDVGGVVGKKGTLYVTKNLQMREPYTGSVPLVSGEIGEDLANYLAKSEQTPSAVALGVLVDKDCSVRAAGGYIIQLMPGGKDDFSEELERQLMIEGPVTARIDSGQTPEDIIEEVLSGFKPRKLAKEEIQFYCRCNRRQVEKMLISMGELELTKIIDEQGQADLRCHFCGDMYHFDRSELKQLLQQAKSGTE